MPAGYPRYCTATTLPDGTTVLNGGRSRRGKPRGPPGSRELQTALKGCDDPLFLDFIRRCLEWDPAARMTPNAALRHAWLRRRLPRPPQVRHHLWQQQGPHLRFWYESTLKWIIGCGLRLNYFVNQVCKIQRGGVDFPDTSNIVWLSWIILFIIYLKY